MLIAPEGEETLQDHFRVQNARNNIVMTQRTRHLPGWPVNSSPSLHPLPIAMIVPILTAKNYLIPRVLFMHFESGNAPTAKQYYIK